MVWEGESSRAGRKFAGYILLLLSGNSLLDLGCHLLVSVIGNSFEAARQQMTSNNLTGTLSPAVLGLGLFRWGLISSN